MEPRGRAPRGDVEAGAERGVKGAERAGSALPWVVSFDAEANGLHGEVFAVGAVLLDPCGRLVKQFNARCPIEGTVVPWVRSNVLPALGNEVSHLTPRWMRDDFWSWLTETMAAHPKALVVVDCGWPVEAGLLSACVADDPSRAFKGPYPLHEVATLLAAAGLDPLASYGEAVLPGQGHRRHHPVYDAHVSALCARMALERLGWGR